MSAIIERASPENYASSTYVDEQLIEAKHKLDRPANFYRLGAEIEMCTIAHRRCWARLSIMVRTLILATALTASTRASVVRVRREAGYGTKANPSPAMTSLQTVGRSSLDTQPININKDKRSATSSRWPLSKFWSKVLEHLGHAEPGTAPLTRHYSEWPYIETLFNKFIIDLDSSVAKKRKPYPDSRGRVINSIAEMDRTVRPDMSGMGGILYSDDHAETVDVESYDERLLSGHPDSMPSSSPSSQYNEHANDEFVELEDKSDLYEGDWEDKDTDRNNAFAPGSLMPSQEHSYHSRIETALALPYDRLQGPSQNLKGSQPKSADEETRSQISSLTSSASHAESIMPSSSLYAENDERHSTTERAILDQTHSEPDPLPVSGITESSSHTSTQIQAQSGLTFSSDRQVVGGDQAANSAFHATNDQLADRNQSTNSDQVASYDHLGVNDQFVGDSQLEIHDEFPSRDYQFNRDQLAGSDHVANRDQVSRSDHLANDDQGGSDSPQVARGNQEASSDHFANRDMVANGDPAGNYDQGIYHGQATSNEEAASGDDVVADEPVSFTAQAAENDQASDLDQPISSAQTLETQSGLVPPMPSTQTSSLRHFTGSPKGVVRGENVTQLSLMVYKIAKAEKIVSMAAAPCREVQHWMPLVALRLEFEIPGFQFYCVDTTVPSQPLDDLKTTYGEVSGGFIQTPPEDVGKLLPKNIDMLVTWMGMQQWGVRNSWRFIKGLRRSGVRLALIGNNRQGTNAAMTGKTLNIRKSPLLFKEPSRVIGKVSTEGDKQLLLYSMNELRNGF